MKRPVVRCRCGHRVLSKEVLRTDLYERSIGREYVYIKFRCKRCKRVGESFVAEASWDWRILEPRPSDMSEAESATFADKTPLGCEEMIDFHQQLKKIMTISQLRETGRETPANPIIAQIESLSENATPSKQGTPPATAESANPNIVRPKVRVKNQRPDEGNSRKP